MKLLLSCEKRVAKLISCHCHLLPPPLPSLSAITHPTKVRWLLQEEERESGGGDHSAKYNADERKEENVQNGQLQS